MARSHLHSLSSFARAPTASPRLIQTPTVTPSLPCRHRRCPPCRRRCLRDGRRRCHGSTTVRIKNGTSRGLRRPSCNARASAPPRHHHCRSRSSTLLPTSCSLWSLHGDGVLIFRWRNRPTLCWARSRPWCWSLTLPSARCFRARLGSRWLSRRSIPTDWSGFKRSCFRVCGLLVAAAATTGGRSACCSIRLIRATTRRVPGLHEGSYLHD